MRSLPKRFALKIVLLNTYQNNFDYLPKKDKYRHFIPFFERLGRQDPLAREQVKNNCIERNENECNILISSISLKYNGTFLC